MCGVLRLFNIFMDKCLFRIALRGKVDDFTSGDELSTGYDVEKTYGHVGRSFDAFYRIIKSYNLLR